MRNIPFETMEEIEEYVSGSTIECLECGRHFKMITGKHLQQVHDITQDEYREKWGIPRTLGLAIAALKEVKRDQALKMHADGVLTVDHLPAASDPRTRSSPPRGWRPVALMLLISSVSASGAGAPWAGRG